MIIWVFVRNHTKVGLGFRGFVTPYISTRKLYNPLVLSCHHLLLFLIIRGYTRWGTLSFPYRTERAYKLAHPTHMLYSVGYTRQIGLYFFAELNRINCIFECDKPTKKRTIDGLTPPVSLTEERKPCNHTPNQTKINIYSIEKYWPIRMRTPNIREAEVKQPNYDIAWFYMNIHTG